jgi:hypothetical protein
VHEAALAGDSVSDALKRYRDAERDLIHVRWMHSGFDSPREDVVIESLADAWEALTDEEREIIEAEPRRSLIRSTQGKGMVSIQDLDVLSADERSRPPRRRVEVA